MSVFVVCVLGLVTLTALASWCGLKLRQHDARQALLEASGEEGEIVTPRWWEEGTRWPSFWGEVVEQAWSAMWIGVRCACGAAGVMAGITVFGQVWKWVR